MSDIKEKMNRMDRANYNRLQASITPTQNKINKEKAKLQTIVTEATAKIKAWESEIADFKSIAKGIEDKYVESTETTTTEEVITTEVSETTTDVIGAEVDSIPVFGEEDKDSVPFS